MQEDEGDGLALAMDLGSTEPIVRATPRPGSSTIPIFRASAQATVSL